MGRRHVNLKTRSHGREHLSLREAIVLADVPEKAVRKDIETGILTALRTVRNEGGRIRFEWHHVFVLAAVYGNSSLNGRMRRATMESVEDLARKSDSTATRVALDKYISIDWKKVYRDVQPRVETYATGLARIEERADLFGGDAVFKGTRLPVAHIGKMIADGESPANVLEDFPSLTSEDLAFAELYRRANPPVGRPPRANLDVAAPS